MGKQIDSGFLKRSRNHVDDAGLKMSQITMTTDDLAQILATVLVQVGPSMPGKPSGGQESTSSGETNGAELKRKNAELERKNVELERKNAELERKNAGLEKKNFELEQEQTKCSVCDPTDYYEYLSNELTIPTPPPLPPSGFLPTFEHWTRRFYLARQ